MQAIAPVTTEQLLHKSQQPLMKLEIYATNLVLNGEFSDDVSGWSKNNTTLSRVASASDPGTASGGFDDWVMKMVDIGAASTAYQAFTTKIGESYRIIAKYYRVGGAGSLRARQNTWDGAIIQTEAFATAGVWTVITLNFVAATTITVLTFENTSAVLYFDSVNFFILPEWINLCDLGGKNYLESISMSFARAIMSPNPIAASFSAEINNEGAIFHQKHPDSAYSGYFTAGRKVRISVGATYGGSDYYWQRIIGYMDEPRLSGKTFNVTIRGLDYMKPLINMQFKQPDNYWGSSITEPTKVSKETLGTEIYDEFDAMEIEHEDDNVANWDLSDKANISSVSETGGGSSYAGHMTKEGSAESPNASGWVANNDIGNVSQGKRYKLAFKYKKMQAAYGILKVGIYKTGTDELMAEIDNLTSESWIQINHCFDASEDCAVKMKLTITGAPKETCPFRIDQISLREITGIENAGYPLPDECKGAYYVTLDGEVIYYRDEGKGWYYDNEANRVFIENGRRLAADQSLKIYYFTQQISENVVADILVRAGFYVNQAAALASMDYVETNVNIDRVWFETGSSYLNALKMLCERCDYRFYFKYNGTPVFEPFPTAKVAGSEDLFFRKWHISNPEYYEDINEIKNKIIIKGKKQAQPVSYEENMPSELIGEASDATSINTYGEHTLSITNHLFQTQASIDTMKATLLARYKDPKWYFDFGTPYNPAPLEIWDTVKAELRLKGSISSNKYGTFKYDSGVKYGGAILVEIRALVRDIKIDNYNFTYKCEEVT